MYGLEGRTAIVTGGGQGLGEAICRRLAGEGVRVAVADISEDRLTDVSRSLRDTCGAPSIAVRTDVTVEKEVEKLVRKTTDEWGRLDIMVCNAGVLIAGEIAEFSFSDFRKVISVNLLGYFLCAKHAARVMKPNKSGVIVQINSKSGKKGSYKNSAYASSKFGGIGLTQSIALDLAPYNIRVNAICPGNLLDSPLWVNSLYAQYAKKWGITEEEVRARYTEQVPLKRGCTYDDVTSLLLFLVSDGASYMTGQAINVTGGQEMR